MSATRISVLLIAMSALYACAGPVGEPPVKDGDSSGSLDNDDDELTSGVTGGLTGSVGSVGSVGSSGSGASSSTTGSSTSGGTTGGTSGATSVSSASSGGGQFCDNSGDCNTCGACAEQDMCAYALDACFNNQDCSNLLDCLQGCPDDQCAFQCFDQFPGAEQPYTELSDCVLCGACPNDCSGGGC